MDIPINDGRRPSLLELGRRATGEVEGPVPEDLQADLALARAQVKPFDAEILFKAAARLDERPVRLPTPPRRWWAWFAMPLAVAAAALLFLRDPTERAKGGGPTGEATVEMMILQDGVVNALGDAAPAEAGDQVQFAYTAAGRKGLVLLSVDGAGRASVFWPERGDAPEPIASQGRQLLEGSVVLDDAPGPEAWLAFFDPASVHEAEARASRAWAEAGLAGLEALAAEDPAVDLLVLPRAD